MDNKQKSLEFMGILSIFMETESGADHKLLWNERDVKYYCDLPDEDFNSFYTKLRKEIFRESRHFEGLQKTASLPCFLHLVCRKCQSAKNHGGIRIYGKCHRDMDLAKVFFIKKGIEFDKIFTRKKYQEIIKYLEGIDERTTF